MRRAALFVAAFGILVGGEFSKASAGAVNFSDNFEGATLDPFWNDNFAQNGSITFPSTLQAHTGTQSVQLNSIGGVGQIDVLLQHDFATSIFGTFSVWVYDTPALQASGNYIHLDVANTTTGKYAQVGALDYNLGGSSANYYVTPFGGSDITSTVARTPAWHEFQITDLPNSLILSVDGTQVYLGPTGTPVDFLQIGIFGPSFRPSETEFVDDFSLTGYTATPEPATLTLLGIGIVGMAGYGWRRRRRVA